MPPAESAPVVVFSARGRSDQDKGFNSNDQLEVLAEPPPVRSCLLDSRKEAFVLGSFFSYFPPRLAAARPLSSRLWAPDGEFLEGTKGSQGMGVAGNSWFDHVLLEVLYMFKPSG